MPINPRAGDEYSDGHVRDATYGDLAVKVNSGNVSLSTADIEVGKVKVLGSDGSTVADVLSSAPAGDTGQNAVAVRVISQLGAGAGGAGSGQIQVRSAANVSTDVGYAAGDQKVPVDGSGVTQPVSGPLTDTQLRASAVPVSGTFFQATQPVSGTVTATGPLTDTQLRATAVPVSGPLTDTQLRASAVPVSGPLTDTQLRASAVPVTAAQATAANLNATVVQATAANLNATVTGPALTKGTQGATGFSTQDLKDAGRVGVTITGFQVAGIITTEALFAASLVRAADGVAAAAAAQHTVTAGKRFRIESIMVTVKNTAAAAGTSKLALRYRPAGGTVAITDSIIAILDIGSNNATAANYIGPYIMPIPDGFELVGSATFGFTNLSSAVTMLHTITVIGFEY